MKKKQRSLKKKEQVTKPIWYAKITTDFFESRGNEAILVLLE